MKDGTAGPISRAEFEALFLSVNDTSYARPFVELGEGKGYEAHTQAMVQCVRQSLAVDRTTQALYLLPFSGQTNPSAAGGARATTQLAIARSSGFARELTIPRGFLVAEELEDMSPAGGAPTRTGRRVVVIANAGFAPGNAGPINVLIAAEFIGTTYNNIAPGNLTEIDQVGADFTRGFASIVPGLRQHALVLDPNPDVISAAMVGNYVQLLAGTNAGAVRRIVGYLEPNVAAMPPDGGTALLAATGVYRLASVGGQFLPGELVTQIATGATATVVFHDGLYLVADRQSGPNLTVGPVLLGSTSGTVAVANSVDQSPDLIAESLTATWKVLGWATDLGVTTTNAAAPTGGTAAMLDELASEVLVGRSAGESDVDLAERAARPFDLITPKAVLRSANRILARYGLNATLREVGRLNFPGLYLDGDPRSVDPAEAFAFDMDATSRGGADAYKLDLDYLEFRAFMLVGVPPIDLGEFGICFDTGSYNAFDASPWLAFTDGFPLTAATIYRSVWQEVNRTKAGGVGFDLILDS